MDEILKDTRKKCYSCNEIIDDGEFVHRISYGDWNIQMCDFNHEPKVENYCRSCWTEMKPHNKGVEFTVTSPEQLFNTVNSSDGELVIDLHSHSIGSSINIQIVEERIYLSTAQLRRIPENVISTYYRFKEIERERFNDLISGLIDSELPSYVYLKNSKDTPFDKFNTKKKSQSEITAFNGDKE